MPTCLLNFIYILSMSDFVRQQNRLLYYLMDKPSIRKENQNGHDKSLLVDVHITQAAKDILQLPL